MAKSVPPDPSVTPHSRGARAATQAGGSLPETTVTVKLHAAVFVQASTAVQVTMVVPSGNGSLRPRLSLRTQLETSGPRQLSEAAGGTMTTGSPSSAVMLAGQVICGGVVSLTVMV